MTKSYVKWNCAEDGTVEANDLARSYPDSLCVSARDYDDLSDENFRLRRALRLIETGSKQHYVEGDYGYQFSIIAREALTPTGRA